MLISFVRTLLLYVVITLAIRLMGKRQVGELEPGELVVTILISELAAVPMQDNAIPLVNGVVPIVTLVLAEMILSTLLLYKRGLRGFLCGKPSIVVSDGEIDQSELRRCRVTMEELCEELRLKDVSDIKSVKYAIIETNGRLSVIKRYCDAQATRAELHITGGDPGLARTLISDGKLLRENLRLIGRDDAWLRREIIAAGLDSPEDVFYMAVNDKAETILVKKDSE